MGGPSSGNRAFKRFGMLEGESGDLSTLLQSSDL